MMTASKAQEFAQEWIAAWNAHDLDSILSHYSADIVLTSPVAARILNDSSGTVRGKDALRAYFTRGLEEFDEQGKVIRVVANYSG